MLIKLLNQKSNKDILLDDGFLLDVQNLIEYAALLGVSFYFVSGFRKDTNVQGAIVPPAQKSNHLIGCAFDADIIHHGKFYNSEALSGVLPEEIKKVIAMWKGMGNRWGGDFSKKDVVHFDNGLNIKLPDLWRQKYNQYHD